jgi:hypothetical protein
MSAEADLTPLAAQPGPSTLEYHDEAFPGRPLLLHAARPAGWHPGMPVLLVHHGVARNGGDYRDYWMPHGEGILVIAIEFPQTSFPEYLCYNFGNLHAADGTPHPRERWTYGIGPRLFRRLLAQGLTTVPRYGLFGHSAGGQYVHRMLSFGVPADDLASILSFPLTIMAGTEDTKITGRFFPKGPKSMRQGPNRFARAHAYFQRGQQAAATLGIRCAWRLIEVPGVGHDGRRMSDAAATVVRHALLGH